MSTTKSYAKSIRQLIKRKPFYENTQRSVRMFTRTENDSVLNSFEHEANIFNMMLYIKENYFSHTLKNKFNACSLNVNIKDVILNKNKKKYIKNHFDTIFVSYNENYNECYEQDAFEYIHAQMEQNNPIFMMINFIDYLYFEENDDYAAHSCSLIMLPEDDSSENDEKKSIKSKKSKKLKKTNQTRYRMYYINSHGYAKTDIISVKINNFSGKKRKVKEINTNESIDIIYLKMFKENLNRYLKEKYNEYDLKKKYSVLFSGTKTNIFKGANLQCEDATGLCYVFPHLIYYYFGKFYNKKQYFIKDRVTLKFPCTKLLFKNNKINDFVNGIIMDIDKEFKNYMFDYYANKSEVKQKRGKYICDYTLNNRMSYSQFTKEIIMIEEYIEAQGVAFLCNLAAPLIEFSNQREIINL